MTSKPERPSSRQRLGIGRQHAAGCLRNDFLPELGLTLLPVVEEAPGPDHREFLLAVIRSGGNAGLQAQARLRSSGRGHNFHPLQHQRFSRFG